ncbi:MAG: DNA primase [Flavobacterium psychrophilum]
MKRIIVDYSKLTNEILNLLVDRFPDGYDDSNVIRFRNTQNELVEAVEVRTEDTIYLVKVSTKLANRLEKFEDEDLEDIVVPIDAIKGIDGEIGDEEEEEEETDLSKDPAGSADDDDEDEDEDENDPIDEEDEEE